MITNAKHTSEYGTGIDTGILWHYVTLTVAGVEYRGRGTSVELAREDACKNVYITLITEAARKVRIVTTVRCFLDDDSQG